MSPSHIQAHPSHQSMITDRKDNAADTSLNSQAHQEKGKPLD